MERPPRPNIVYLHCHDAGRWVSPLGHPVHTPNLERLAADGVLFRNAHCAAPTCSPSRAALLTGRPAHEVGLLGLAHLGWGLSSESRTFVRELQAAGYATALCGVQHVRGHQDPRGLQGLGYDESIPAPRLPGEEDVSGLAATDRAVARAAARWISGRPQGAPFFLDVGFLLPHRPFEPDRSGAIPPGPHPAPAVPDTLEARADAADYASSVGHMDACLGEVLDALERSGLGASTLVIATTDHGVAFPGHKCQLNDRGTGVFLLLRGPGYAGGQRVDALVSHLDLFPTVCRAAGLPVPPGLRGRPLPAGDLAGPGGHDALFSEVTYHAAYEPQRSVRTLRWRLVRRFNPAWSRPVLPNIDGGPSKDAWVAAGGAVEVTPMTALYDLETDPGETVNLADDPAHRTVRADLEARLTRWMVETSDPLLSGPVPLPAGGAAWPVDAPGYDSMDPLRVDRDTVAATLPGWRGGAESGPSARPAGG